MCADTNELCEMERIYKKKAVGGKRRTNKRKKTNKRTQRFL